jgi:hypothetical protein
MQIFSRICSLLLLGIAASPALQAETVWSVGHGYLSGGVLGVQYQTIHDDQKWTLAAGLVGASAGWQVSLDPEQKHSVGFAAGLELFTAEFGFLVASYQFHPEGFSKSGMRFGFSAGLRREDESGWWADQGRKTNEAAVALEIGYQF